MWIFTPGFLCNIWWFVAYWKISICNCRLPFYLPPPNPPAVIQRLKWLLNLTISGRHYYYNGLWCRKVKWRNSRAISGEERNSSSCFAIEMKYRKYVVQSRMRLKLTSKSIHVYFLSIIMDHDELTSDHMFKFQKELFFNLDLRFKFRSFLILFFYRR